jgi:O-antigen ligase
MMQDGGLIALVAMTTCYVAIFRRVWQSRAKSRPMVAVTVGMLSSVLTSTIFYPNLATGWYLAFYFICLHIAMTPTAEGPAMAPANRGRRQKGRGWQRATESFRPLQRMYNRRMNSAEPDERP